MRRKLWLVLFSLIFAFILIPSTKAYAADNAYVMCLYDEETMCYRTTVVFSGEEVELGLLKKYYEGEYYFGVLNTDNLAMSYINGNPDPIVGALSPTKFCNKYTLTGDLYIPTFGTLESVDDVDLDRTDKNWRNQISSVCTFPTNYHHNATQADINRAYEVAETLGGDLTEALIFLNDEKAYNSVSNIQYLYQMRYYLLKGLKDDIKVQNAYGSEYLISKTNDYEVTIKKLGHYEKWDESSTSVMAGWSDFVSEPGQPSRTFTWRMRKGYKQKYDGKSISEVNFQDGYEGLNKLDGSVYGSVNLETMKEDTDVTYNDYISWVHLIVEADLAKHAGITYQNPTDLYSYDSTENEMMTKVLSTLNDLEASLDCYSITDLVFNQGAFGTDAYFYGCFPSSWLPYISTFYLIFSILALSLVALSLTISVGKNTISSASANARFTLMQDVSNLFIAALCVVVGIGLINIMFYISDLIVSIFSDISIATGRTIEGMQPSHSGHNLATALIQFGYFGLKVYINITYVMRRFLLMGMFSAAPLFIIAFSFGQKGREITMRWLSELIGHITIQPVQAATFAVILTVSTGLRGVESISLLCCILPLTNFYRGLITKGGNFAVQQGSKLGGTLIGQQASMLGAQAMIDATEEGKEKGMITGGAAALGVGIASGVVTGNPWIGVAAGAGAYSSVSKTVSDKYRAGGQEMQAAFQTGGAMANMVASGGEESGVSSGISGMVSANTAKTDAEMSHYNAIAQTVGSVARDKTYADRFSGKSRGGLIGGGPSSGGPSGGGSDGGFSSGAMSQEAFVNQSVTDNLSQRFNKASCQCQIGNNGEITGGTVQIGKPIPSSGSKEVSDAQAKAYTSLVNSMSQMKLCNPGSPTYGEAMIAGNKALSTLGFSGVQANNVSMGAQGTLKVQIDASQMNELIKGVTSAANYNNNH